MTMKKRFGISIPSRMAEELDHVAELDGVDRSRVVTAAIREFLHRERHVPEEHECSGLLIIHDVLSLDELNEAYRELVRSTLSIRLEEGFVTIVVVEGSFREITDLRKHIAEKTRRSRVVEYIPIYCSFKRQRDE